MKIKRTLHRICIVILLSIVSCLYGFSQSPIVTTNTAIASPPVTVNTTICNNQLPYLWNSINCLTAGTYTATLVDVNGADSVVTLNLTVINVSTSITNAVICDNELPYHWNGNIYSSNGTYSVTLTSSSGCDSVPILSLTVNHVVSSSTNTTICSNQLPYSWNGNNYPGAGTYVVTLTSTANCDSIATLNLVVKPASYSTTNVTVCSNRLPYHWNGNSYPAVGTYSIVLPAANGCDSIATLNLSTVPTTSGNTSVTVCTNHLPYVWNGQSYIVGGTYSVLLVGSNSNGCDSTAMLNLTIVPVATTITNIVICTGQLPYTWNGNSYPIPGNYQVTLSAVNGCDSIAKLHLLAFDFLTDTSNQIVCISDLPYVWNGNNYFASGTYSASFVTAAGCDSIGVLQLYVHEPSLGTDSLIVCENEMPYNFHGHVLNTAGEFAIVPPFYISDCFSIDSVHLVVLPQLSSQTAVSICNNEIPYIWSGNAYTTTGSYIINFTSSGGCDSTATLNLTVNDTVISVTNITICSDFTPYLWNGNLYNTTGLYSSAAFVSSTGCDSVAMLNLIVNPVTNTGVDVIICTAQAPYNWNGTDYFTTGIYSITLTSVDNCDSVVTLTLLIQNILTSTTHISICDNFLPYSWNGNVYPTAGTYSVLLTSTAGCDSLATLILGVNPVITSTTTTHICHTQLPYLWNGNSYSAAGTYSVTLLTSGGCDSVATLNLFAHLTVTSLTETTICNNQLPYTWNTIDCSQGGLFTAMLTSSVGCDSIAILNLTVTDILTSTTNVNICPQLLPYIWNGNSYPVGGTYSVTLHNANGCDSVPILSLIVTPYVTSTTDIAICNNELPYSWNGNVYNAGGTYSVLLAGSVCDSLTTLNLTVYLPITSITTVTVCQQQFPYNWNGNSYLIPGNYSITLTGSGGCDSVATLILSEIPAFTSTTNITICTNQLPYNWNGNVYDIAGSYSVPLLTSSGCDSIATLNLATALIDTSITNIMLCSSQLPYVWNGNNYAASGTYFITLAGSNGCDSVAKLVLVATSVVTSLSNANVCANQLPYTWNGNNYTISGNYTITLTSTGGCDSLATLALIVHPVFTNSETANICSNQLPFVWNGQSYTTAGSHVITLTSVAGCDSVVTLNLNINPVLSSNSPVTTCSNQLPFVWNGQDYSTNGTYSVTLTSAAGCDSVATLQLTINQATNSNSNYTLCSAQAPYNWNGQNYAVSGTYTATLTGSTGCDSIATLNLTVNPTPPAPVVTSPVNYCQDDPTVSLIANTTVTSAYLLWYTAATGGTGSTITPTASSATTGTTNYYVSQVDGPCEGPRALITITINSSPDLGPDKPLVICYGESADLTALYNTSGYTSYWTSNQQPVTNPQAITVAGSYQLIAVSNSGCSDTAAATLTIQPPLTANAGNDADVEYNIPYQLTGSGGGQYQWSPSNHLNNSHIATPVATLTESTSFVLMVTDNIGCFDLDTVNLRVLRGPTFYVPSAFTPNGDGVNDVFRPTAVGIAKLHFFRVFNRYGELVFETSEIGKGWNGVYKGIKQPGGNYVWSLKGTDRKGEDKIMRGNVILIR